MHLHVCIMIMIHTSLRRYLWKRSCSPKPLLVSRCRTRNERPGRGGPQTFKAPQGASPCSAASGRLGKKRWGAVYLQDSARARSTLGSFSTEEDARAYDRAFIKQYGTRSAPAERHARTLHGTRAVSLDDRAGGSACFLLIAKRS